MALPSYALTPLPSRRWFDYVTDAEFAFKAQTAGLVPANFGNITGFAIRSPAGSPTVPATGTGHPYYSASQYFYEIGTTGVPESIQVAGYGYCNGLDLYHYYGGHRGGRQSVFVWAQHRGAAVANTINRNYVGIASGWSATGSDGGTGVTMSTAKGAGFVLGPIAISYPGATNWLELTGGEFNVQASALSSVAY